MVRNHGLCEVQRLKRLNLVASSFRIGDQILSHTQAHNPTTRQPEQPVDCLAGPISTREFISPIMSWGTILLCDESIVFLWYINGLVQNELEV
jgi:hypothetical protein